MLVRKQSLCSWGTTLLGLLPCSPSRESSLFCLYTSGYMSISVFFCAKLSKDSQWKTELLSTGFKTREGVTSNIPIMYRVWPQLIFRKTVLQESGTVRGHKNKPKVFHYWSEQQGLGKGPAHTAPETGVKQYSWGKLREAIPATANESGFTDKIFLRLSHLTLTVVSEHLPNQTKAIAKPAGFQELSGTSMNSLENFGRTLGYFFLSFALTRLDSSTKS